ncbi:hypothetical protein WBG99_20520 [Streptomyces sp. TG1A-60]|uniref:hypothetical protein n=1 Tax=Streptomyces sp. TG1A-60 TaxID=3129111 RepID=UPI0030CE120A
MRPRHGNRPHTSRRSVPGPPDNRLSGPDHGMRRIEYALFLAAALLGTAGALSDALWLLGIAAWVLIVAGLIEMIYRP